MQNVLAPDLKSDSYNYDNSRVCFTSSTTRRNMSSCCPRELETKMSQSSTDLIARGGQDSGNTISYSQRATEAETVDVAVNLNASLGQGCGQGEITTLGTPRAMETKMIVSNEEFTAGNTTLSTPRAMETVNVESSGGLSSRHGLGCGQDETISLGTPREIETQMIVSSEDLTVGKTSLSTPRAIEIVSLESSGDMIAGKTTSCTTPRAMEMELVDAGGDSFAEQKQDLGQGNKTKLCISREIETETVVFGADLMAMPKQIFGKGGTSGTPREVKNKMAETSMESIARRKRVCGRGVIEKGPSSPEGNATDKKRDSPVPERARSSKRGARRGMQGTWNQPIQKRARIGEENKEICDPGSSSIMEEGPSSPERQATNNKRGSSLLERVRSCKRGTKRSMQGTSSQPTQKRVRIVEQNKEVSNHGPSSIMENGPSSLERQAANKKGGSPSSERVRSCKKTTFLWLIDSRIIKKDERVSYKSATMKRALAGRITRGGILCSCCQEEVSMWTFEKHAGSDLRQPYKHIYIHRKRKSLRKCLIDVWLHALEQKRGHMFSYVPKETDSDQNDDVCSVCGDGGDLICCDKCPSTYHLSCMNIEKVPQNDWFCPYCVCKHCGLVVDLVIEKKEYYEKKEGFKCSQCDKKYHWECFEKSEKESSKQTPDFNPSRSYCGRGCQGIYEKMGVYLGIRNDYSAKYSWRVIRLMETYKNNSADMNLFLENNSKVAVTWMLMNEAFETITDRRTGINVVRSIVYSCKSNLTRIDFSRFYMFVLEEDDVIIAAASIRFHGTRIAEMPFIATEMAYRGQGVCQELMRVIESFLCNLKVENLIIPSAVETCDMWKRKYNFTEVSEELKKEISSYNIVMFPCAVRLCKDLSASIADIKNDLEPHAEHAEITARLEHGPSGRLEVKES